MSHHFFEPASPYRVCGVAAHYQHQPVKTSYPDCTHTTALNTLQLPSRRYVSHYLRHGISYRLAAAKKMTRDGYLNHQISAMKKLLAVKDGAEDEVAKTKDKPEPDTRDTSKEPDTTETAP